MTLQSLNFGLDETLIALRDSVAAFCAKEIAPIAQQVDQNNKFPAQLWKKFLMVFWENPWKSYVLILKVC